MPITAADLIWAKSERMTDEDDGGGRLTAQAIAWGEENQVFDDLTDVERAAGKVSIRKVYAGVASADAAKYLDAGVVVLAPPADPAVSVVAFSTGDFYDERADLATRLESQVVRGGIANAWLWGDHIDGQRSVTLWQRLSYTMPAVGARIELVRREAGVTISNQVLWITRVTEQTIERTDVSGTYYVRQIVCEIAEALRAEYAGVEPLRTDPALTVDGTTVYETRYNPGAVEIVGAQPLQVAATLGDYTLDVGSLYQPLIPTAFAETALADVNPGGDSATLVAAHATTVTFSTALDVVKPGASLYLGTAAMPGTVSIVVSGSTLTDQGGTMLLSGSEIGTIDYGAGVIVWNDACLAYGTATKAVTFRPGVTPTRVADSASQPVTLENRGFVWVITLAPIPAPGTLRVAYRANNAWYVIADRGDGYLRGADSSYGSGSLSFSTGTATVTTGALPDPDSDIIYVWGTPIDYTIRSGQSVNPLRVEEQTDHPDVVPGSFSISWDTVSVSDDGAGGLSGTGGSGWVRYATGEWLLEPSTVPAIGTEFTVDYQNGAGVEEVFDSPARDGNGDIPLTLSAAPQAGSLELEWTVELLAADAEAAWGITEEFTAYRIADGNGFPNFGGTVGWFG